MAEVTGVKVNELPKKTAYDESDLIYVVGNGVDLKMEMKDLKRNVAPDVFSGATELTPGEKGLVPTPTVTDSNKVLGGDGEWKELAPVATSGDFDDLINKPEITEVEANPSGEATEELSKLKVNTTIYKILAAKVHGEASGDLITVEDAMEAPLEDCKVTLEPQQDLHGYDYPWVGGAGKNKFNKSTVNVDKYIGADGQLATSQYNQDVTDFIPVTSGQSYIINSSISTNHYSCFYDENKNVVGSVFANNQFPKVAPSDAKYIRVTFAKADINTFMVEQGTTASSTYYPYSNICPISGWSEANVVVEGGQNLYSDSIVWKNGYYINASGVETQSNLYKYIQTYIEVDPSATYSIQVDITAGTDLAITIPYYTESQSFISRDFISEVNVGTHTYKVDFTTPSNCKYIRMSVPTDTSNIVIYKKYVHIIQFKDGSNPLTVYGGTLDVVSGKLVVTHIIIKVNTLNWYYLQNTFYSGSVGISADGSTDINSDFVCSFAKSVNKEWNQLSNNECVLRKNLYSQGYYSLCVKNTEYTNATDFKNSLDSTSEITFPIATPQTYQLTPTQVKSLLGSNNVWSDGEMYIKYRRDLDIFLNKLEARVRALEEG